jgi:hypothetical protein
MQISAYQLKELDGRDKLVFDSSTRINYDGRM